MNALAEIAHDVGASDRTLRRAMDIGTIRGTRPSPRKVRISHLEATFLRAYWPTIGKLREALSNEKNVEMAVLFGSLARGEAGPDSDLDLAVRLSDPDIERLLELGLRLESRLERTVDLSRLDDVKSTPALASAIGTEGRPIVDRHRAWPTLRTRMKALDSEELEQDRIRTALGSIDQLLEERQ